MKTWKIIYINLAKLPKWVGGPVVFELRQSDSQIHVPSHYAIFLQEMATVVSMLMHCLHLLWATWLTDAPTWLLSC